MNFQSTIKVGKRMVFLLGLIGFMQTMPAAALAADPTVDAVLAVEYDNSAFVATVLVKGPAPIMNVDILVNDGAPVEFDREDRFVLSPSRNLTLFKFTKRGAVVESGDHVTAVVTDTNAEKTVNCALGRIFHQLVVCR